VNGTRPSGFVLLVALVVLLVVATGAIVVAAGDRIGTIVAFLGPTVGVLLILLRADATASKVSDIEEKLDNRYSEHLAKRVEPVSKETAYWDETVTWDGMPWEDEE
jgi:hypothetical protein